MASITSKSHLFFVTSPRSPYKMKGEIKLLNDLFSGSKWSGNQDLQAEFFRELVKNSIIETELTEDDLNDKTKDQLAFSARDRITRAPKSLGLVDLETSSLTSPGLEYVESNNPDEIFTRQLLKFQFPSPFYVDKSDRYNVKPYLELLRLIYDLGGITKDEIAAFATKMINHEMYDRIKEEILKFRYEIANLDRNTNYSRYFQDIFEKSMIEIYNDSIKKDDLYLRERGGEVPTIERFLKTKMRNHLDYADAAFRYLRESKLVVLRSIRSTKLRISDEKIEDVEFILKNLERNARNYSKKEYREYLFNPELPELLVDNSEMIKSEILKLDPELSKDLLDGIELIGLKALRESIITGKKEKKLEEEKEYLQTYSEYEEIVSQFDDVTKRGVPDRPLLFEWNTWRAFTMIDDGEINGNFKLDDFGVPLSTAPGNQADILCEYEDFDLLIEVTLSSGATQWYMEGEPVPRHVGAHQSKIDKTTYCLFIAPKINRYAIAHFFMLHKQKMAIYGNKEVKIIPMSLETLKIFLDAANESDPKPNRANLKKFLESSTVKANESINEESWFNEVEVLAKDWCFQ